MTYHVGTNFDVCTRLVEHTKVDRWNTLHYYDIFQLGKSREVLESSMNPCTVNSTPLDSEQSMITATIAECEELMKPMKANREKIIKKR